MIKDEVIVVGCGIIGLMTAKYLEENDFSVTILEKSEGDKVGGISKSSKSINVRGDLPHWRAHIRSKEIWQRMFEEQSIDFRTVDQLTLGSKTASFMIDLEEKYSARGVEFCRMESAEVRNRYGVLMEEDDNYAITEPNSVLLVDGFDIVSQLRDTIKYYVDIKYQQELGEISSKVGGVIYGKTVDGTSFECKNLVICAGPWAQKLLMMGGLDLGIVNTAQQTSLITFSESDNAKVDLLPYIIDRRTSPWNTHGAGMFLVPGVNGIPTKIGRRGCGPQVDLPYTDEQDPALDRQVHEYCKAALNLTPISSQMEQCYYPTNPTDRIIIGKHDSMPIYYAAGCYGAAFKLAPVVGDAITKLMTNGCVPEDMSFMHRV